MTKAEQIKVLSEQIVTDDVCSALREGATQLVMGEGSLDAKIVFVGRRAREDDLVDHLGASVNFR